jgi:hypothetical protein
MDGTPTAGEVPPELEAEEEDEAASDGPADQPNPERLGPAPAPGDTTPSDADDEEPSSEPPPEASPGQEGITSPKR